jgi:hypothetical protein
VAVYVPQAIEQRIVTVFREVDMAFSCAACGFSATARVRSKGVHIVGMPYGTPHLTTMEFSYTFALDAAEHQAADLLRDAPCPQCGALHPEGIRVAATKESRPRRNLSVALIAVWAVVGIMLLALSLAVLRVLDWFLAALLVAAAATVAPLVIIVMWRPKHAAPLPGVLGSVDFNPTSPARPPYWTRTDRLVYR